MKSAQPTAKDLLECWQDAPLVNRFRRMHSKTKRKIRIKYDLLYEFGRLVKAVHPDIVTMENVGSNLIFQRKARFIRFRESFEK